MKIECTPFRASGFPCTFEYDKSHLDHDFTQTGHPHPCKKCGYNLWIATEKKLSCDDTIKIAMSHTWPPNSTSELIRCNVCGITGAPIFKHFLFGNFYSCNEYLMIKANE